MGTARAANFIQVCSIPKKCDTPLCRPYTHRLPNHWDCRSRSCSLRALRSHTSRSDLISDVLNGFSFRSRVMTPTGTLLTQKGRDAPASIPRQRKIFLVFPMDETATLRGRPDHLFVLVRTFFHGILKFSDHLRPPLEVLGIAERLQPDMTADQPAHGHLGRLEPGVQFIAQDHQRAQKKGIFLVQDQGQVDRLQGQRGAT